MRQTFQFGVALWGIGLQRRWLRLNEGYVSQPEFIVAQEWLAEMKLVMPLCGKVCSSHTKFPCPQPRCATLGWSARVDDSSHRWVVLGWAVMGFSRVVEMINVPDCCYGRRASVYLSFPINLARSNQFWLSLRSISQCHGASISWYIRMSKTDKRLWKEDGKGAASFICTNCPHARKDKFTHIGFK